VLLSRQAIALLHNLGPSAADELVFPATKARQEASGTSGWTRHDLRRIGAAMLGEMGESPDIIEAADGIRLGSIKWPHITT
jgi:hypothetical protein